MGTHPIFESDFDCLTDKVMVAQAIFNAYKTVFDIAADGAYIAIGDNYGKISIMSTLNWRTVATHQTQLSVIYSLQSRAGLLVASGIGGVELLQWNGERIEHKCKLTQAQANKSVIVDQQVVTGLADGRLVVHDQSGKVIEETVVSSETIQGLCHSPSRNILATCGEEGVVKVWDCRASLSKPTSTLNPSQHPATRRKNKYLSAISIRDDWLTVGGGARAALWHIGAGEPAHILDMGDAEPLVMLQAETRILVGGDDGAIHQFKNNGHAISSVATSSNMVYALTESSTGQVYCGGNTGTVDVYKNYGYRTHQVQS